VALLTVFTGMIAYGWVFHDLEDCGCFGPIEIAPGVSIGKNTVLLVLAILAWAGLRQTKRETARPAGIAAVKVLACAAAAGVILPYAFLRLEPSVEADGPDRPFAQFVFEADGVEWDLGTGEYFVAMYSTTCGHCLETIATLNELAMQPDFLLPIVALCYEDEPGSFEEFSALGGAIFPMHSLGGYIRTFFSLVGDAPPRFIYILDGRQVAFWDDEVPEPGQVQQARARTAPHNR